MQLRFRWFRSSWSKSRFIKSQSKRRKRMTIVFILRELLTIIKIAKMKNKANEVEISFIVCFHDCRKENKEKIVKLSNSFSYFNKQLSFILIHSTSSNQNHSKSRWEEEKKMNIINNHWTNSIPHCLTRAWREDKQTTLTQLPAFQTFYKCNEHPITSNAHWYPSGH